MTNHQTPDDPAHSETLDEEASGHQGPLPVPPVAGPAKPVPEPASLAGIDPPVSDDDSADAAPKAVQGYEIDQSGSDPEIVKDEPSDILRQHTLRGHGQRLKANATPTAPLFGDFVRSGQATIIYAPPGSGKTITTIRLVLDAVDEGRTDPDLLYYINADDSSEGLGEKVVILESVNAHMMAPGYRGLKAKDLFSNLGRMAEAGNAKGRVVVIDTLKKFVDIMSKTSSREVGELCRQFVLCGATVLALAHTAKSRNADGSIRFQGTTDFLEDFDAAYTAEPLSGAPGSKEKFIKFTRLKGRADSPEVVAYAYSTEEGVSYADKVASVRLVYPDELDDKALAAALIDDAEVIQEIRGYLVCGHGHVGQDKMIRAISHGANIPRAQVDRVLTKYTGEDPARHKWHWRRTGPRKREYYLLDMPNPPPLPGD